MAHVVTVAAACGPYNRHVRCWTRHPAECEAQQSERSICASTWSPTKPAEHLIKQNVVPTVSRETLRRKLREGN
ncbi:hypothetical protein [Streptomyces sp. NPDC088246]|uniref:hypothetical protein n=1 Tax=Streptomyces sp. NPDC088246 TaxID=3365842 RepID=UPI003825804C